MPDPSPEEILSQCLQSWVPVLVMSILKTSLMHSWPLSQNKVPTSTFLKTQPLVSMTPIKHLVTPFSGCFHKKNTSRSSDKGNIASVKVLSKCEPMNVLPKYWIIHRTTLHHTHAVWKCRICLQFKFVHLIHSKYGNIWTVSWMFRNSNAAVII